LSKYSSDILSYILKLSGQLIGFLIFKPKEVANCLFLVSHLGLKAIPTYIPAACIHHTFQSDMCNVKRGNAKNDWFYAGLFLYWYLNERKRTFEGEIAKQSGKSGIDIAE
jgi:hypothetical protein